MYRLDFSLPGLPKTTNEKRRFGHWAQYHKEATLWKRSVAPYLTAKKPIAPLPKAKVTLMRFSATEPDFDGLVSSFKHILDTLVNLGILVNDKRENIGQPEYVWKHAEKNKGYIRVIVEEVKLN